MKKALKWIGIILGALFVLLIVVGFGLMKAGDDLAAVKQQKDMQIEELEKRITQLNKQLTESQSALQGPTEENIDLRHDQIQEIQELQDKLIGENIRFGKSWKEKQTLKESRILSQMF